ncbi:hypothetical protein [Rhizobium sp.]
MRHFSKFALAALICLLASTWAEAAEKLRPSGTVEIVQRQAGYYLTLGSGKGVLHIGGRNYPFKIAGLGFGGTGFASIKAKGTVYNLKSRRQFAGRYTATRTGFVVGKTSRGKMSLKNANGVQLELTVERSGLMLTFGVDDLTITMK